MQKTLFASAFLATLTMAAAAASAGAEFSAVAVEIRPGHDMEAGSLYVGKTATRYEYQHRGLPIVRIIIPAKGVTRFLFPIDKTYIEYKTKPGTALPGGRSEVPCKPSNRVRCELIAKDRINGLEAERWSIRAKGRRGELRLWWDAKRKIPLRQEYSDGRVMQATLRGSRTFESQKVEDWEFTYMRPDGRYIRTVSLISPELGVAIVEMLPGGIQRRLHSVTIGPPDAKLFEIPKGYKRVKPARPPRHHALSGRSRNPLASSGRHGRQGGMARNPTAGANAAAPKSKGGGQPK